MTDPLFWTDAFGTSLIMMSGGLVWHREWRVQWWIRHPTAFALLFVGRFLLSLHG